MQKSNDAKANEGEPVVLNSLTRCDEEGPVGDAGLSAGSPAFAAPVGWKLVPIEPTPKMIEAAKGALYRYIRSLPEEERRMFLNPDHRVGQTEKFKMRWAAMLTAAPDYEQ